MNMILGWFGLALLLVVSMSYVIYRQNRKDCLVPKSLKGIGLIGWLQQSFHWHDFGHFLADFFFTITTAILLVAMLTVPILSIDTLVIRELWWSTISLMIERPLCFALLCAVPATLLTLYIEIIQDGHWRAFVGKDPNVRDFLFDLFTHLSGGVVAVFMLTSQNLAIQKLIIYIIF